MTKKAFDYVALANVTLSMEWHGDKISKHNFTKTLNAAIEALNQLDKVKKTLFYGRDNNLDPAEGQSSVEDLPARLATPENNIFSTEAAAIIHGIIGLATESGELLEHLRDMINGKPLDRVNVKEEVGDAKWYMAILAKYVGFKWGEDERTNIAKLQDKFAGRYRDAGFTASEANERNLEAERDLLEGNGGDYSPLEAERFALTLEGEAPHRLPSEVEPTRRAIERSDLSKGIGERLSLMPGESASRQRVRASDLPGPDNVGMVNATRQYDSNSFPLDPEAD